MSSHTAWIRYGGTPITEAEINYAQQHCNLAILQPWEGAAAARLKELAPHMTVLAYKCLSSTRSYEPGPIYSSGVSYAQALAAEEKGQEWFARRLNGEKIQWSGYPEHWQMAVWNKHYRATWVQSVVSEIADSPFDGVMADNDVGGDYYGLDLPIRSARTMHRFYRGLNVLIKEAGRALNKEGKILVPNVAESREYPGKWKAHTAYGGGFEEVFLGWGAQEYLNEYAAVGQVKEMTRKLPPVKVAGQLQERITVLHSVTDGSLDHPNALAGLAGFWIFGGGSWTAYSATGHDSYDETPWIPQQGWGLGDPLEPVQRQDGGLYTRTFTAGWAAINLGEHPVVANPPEPKPGQPQLLDERGERIRKVHLAAHQGIILHSDTAN